jgi:hypothetical protein
MNAPQRISGTTTNQRLDIRSDATLGESGLEGSASVSETRDQCRPIMDILSRGKDKIWWVITEGTREL